MTVLLTFIRTNWVYITLVILAVITILSLWPLDLLPPAPGSDKAHHVIAYAILMFPTALRKPKFWLLIGLFFLCWGGSIELLQPYVNRYGEWSDMIANAIGLICGLLAAELVRRTRLVY
ncbi:MAG: VanZ family protein [Gammaproteobacteria bacterium]|nr:VanZ family protein [Gammaproteobacteria bacterium]